jgi:hypothetical protein
MDTSFVVVPPQNVRQLDERLLQIRTRKEVGMEHWKATVYAKHAPYRLRWWHELFGCRPCWDDTKESRDKWFNENAEWVMWDATPMSLDILCDEQLRVVEMLRDAAIRDLTVQLTREEFYLSGIV